MNILSCKKLNIGYGDKVVCKDISFSIEKGQYWCVVGENGSGKSTLIKTILGLLKPVKGSVIFSDNVNNKKIGYLPQQTEFQKDFPATVREIIMTGFINQMGLRPFYNRSEKDKATLLMRNLDISDLAGKSFKEISGGQQQKVLLARALLATEDLLVLDEPTNALDAKSIKTFYQTINNLNKQNSLTILMILHNLEHVIENATHILYLKNEALFVGTKEDFLNTEYVNNFCKHEREKV